MQVQKLAVIDIRQEVKIITSCFLIANFILGIFVLL